MKNTLRYPFGDGSNLKLKPKEFQIFLSSKTPKKLVQEAISSENNMTQTIQIAPSRLRNSSMNLISDFKKMFF